METLLHIEGMTCQHCQQAVERSLSQVAGVTRVRVDLTEKTALISGQADSADLREAVEDAGFTLISRV